MMAEMKLCADPVGCSSMAVWSQSLYIVIPLVCLILGHWSLLLHGMLQIAARSLYSTDLLRQAFC